MTTTQLIALDLVTATATVACWLAAGVLAAGTLASGAPTDAAADAARRRRARHALALIASGILALLAQAAVVVLLSTRGWWFVQEKVVFALPVTLVATVAAALLAGPALVRIARGRSASGSRASVTTAVVSACAASVAGLAARQLVGYPLTLGAAATLLLLTTLATWLSYVILAGLGRRLLVGVAGLTALVVGASVGSAWLGDVAAPGSLAAAHAAHAGEAAAATTPAGSVVSVADLRTPAEASPTGDVKRFALTAQQQVVTLEGVGTVNAWSYGSVPGPEVRVTEGDLVEVTLANRDIGAGVTIHWHGYDVPNGEDGVAGVTQNAVLPGESFTYRFTADDPGTYWYHTHQASAEGVQRGLYGTLVVLPRGGIAEAVDLALPVHALGGALLMGDATTEQRRAVAAGARVRIRLINTDQVPRRFRVTGTAFEVAAVDGRDLNRPTAIEDRALRLPAGGRLDVTLSMPNSPVRVTTDASPRAGLTLSPGAAARSDTAIEPHDGPDLDLLGYGTPEAAAMPEGSGTVLASMVLDRLPRFRHGLPSVAYTVDGAVFPHIDSIEVTEGDVVRLTVANRGWETHPMHVHGHHVLVLSRNGVPASGSPLWLDTFDVQPGEVWEVAFLADNPGIWMDHCHNLDHAAEGMMMALRYRGVTTSFEQGGAHSNRSE
ncbi:multicopper oxidase family protein [Cryobacterium melibiosiphilum]|uniref:Multicopper oxidase family protein n=1 Tax=Cryobacterium melibiosiphilum TaxID=995039 RepID=A0A3A5MJ81_9MICO|nr:multicopper oxidase family protein [Cryobacterium melibiosiphilum]RJT89095.1 multicopper oxidase family protein [Cryobacterium melibiosiphilum]